MEKEELMAQIGERIRRRRATKNLSRRELGALCSLSGQSLWSIESGRADPKVSTLAAIAEALGMEMAEVVGYPPLLPVDEEIIPDEEDVMLFIHGIERVIADFQARLVEKGGDRDSY